MRSLPAPAIVALLLALAACFPAVAQAPAASAALAEGDRAWQQRAVPSGRDDWRPDAEAVERALTAFARAVEEAPGDLAARRKLLAALYFQGEHLASGKDGRRQVFDRGKAVGDAALAHLATLAAGGADGFADLPPEERAERIAEGLAGLAGDPARLRTDAAALYFWTAVHWGLWADAYGPLAAVREGVAGTVRDQALTAIHLDARVERGGPHRVLGRLHAEAPRVPFFTGWIDRDRAVEELERAVELGPDEPLNRVYLAEALLEHHRRRRSEALEQLRVVLEQPVAPPRAVEKAAARRRARELLEEASR